MSETVDLAMIRSYLKHKYGMQEQQCEKLLRVSANSIKDSLNAAEKSLNNSDWAALSESTHKLKGTLLIISLKYWAEKAEKIQLAVEQGTELDYKSRIAELREGLNLLCDLY